MSMTKDEAVSILRQQDPALDDLKRVMAAYAAEGVDSVIYRRANALALEHPEVKEKAREQRQEDQYQERLDFYRADLRARRDAKQELDDEDMAEAEKDLRVWDAEAFAAEPPIEPIMEEVLAPEVNLLGGPGAAGKSLLARDWSLSVASGMPWNGYAVARPRHVFWVASEGLHDFPARWPSQPLWGAAKERLHIIPDPVSLTTPRGVDWLLKQCAPYDCGLIAFDVIYGMGMADDSGVKDALPVLNAMKRISAETGAATLALGHPPHESSKSTRRFRGSSMWRQLAYVEWHMAEARLTQEKSKIGDKEKHKYPYSSEYPSVRLLTQAEANRERQAFEAAIAEAIGRDPKATDKQIAERLAPAFDRSPDAARHVVRQVRKEYGEMLA